MKKAKTKIDYIKQKKAEGNYSEDDDDDEDDNSDDDDDYDDDDDIETNLSLVRTKQKSILKQLIMRKSRSTQKILR